MKRKKAFGITAVAFIVIALSAANGFAQPVPSNRFSVLGGVGISGARGDYPSEYDAKVEFSFLPGLRYRGDRLITPESFLIIDFGYLETGFIGYVAPPIRIFTTRTHI